MLESILHHLDRVYRLELEVDIRDYLVSEDTCARLGLDPGHGSVLVKQAAGEEELQLGLYIGEQDLERLTDFDLTLAPTAASLEVLFLAIEEVSHFAYLLFSASRERRVTELELELQAEVDKFVTSTTLLAARNQGRVPSDLLDRLFGDFVPRSDLDSESRERYVAASSLASRYCSYVVQATLARERGISALLPELRSFYRLSQPGKIRRIHNVVYSA